MTEARHQLLPDKPSWFPHGLALFCGLVPVTWCLSYAITGVVVGSHVGRQSSTAGIAAFFAVMAALPLSLVGFSLGRLFMRIPVPARGKQVSCVAKWCASIALVAIAVAASRHASGPIYAAEREARPRVILNSAQLHKQTERLHIESALRGSRVYDSLGKVNDAIHWRSGDVQFKDLVKTLEVRFSWMDTPLLIPLPGIDYINFVDAMPMKMGTDARPALALLITGRATGHRDLLAVISQSGELVYFELLDRFWNYSSVPLAITPGATGDLILVGSDPQRLLVFAPQDAANPSVRGSR